MNQQITLQQQFPLSPRKFWKKMLHKIIGFVFVQLFFIAIISPLYSMSNGFKYTDIGIIVFFVITVEFVVCLSLVLLYAWYVKTYIKRYYYSGEQNFITIKKGVFAPTEIHVQWQKIQDVYVDQDVVDRIMGLYDVHIASATASSGIEAHIDGVDEAAANGLKDFFLNKISDAGKNNYTNTSTQPLNQVHTPQVVDSTINISETISNSTYPLTSKWMTLSLINALIISLVSPFFLAIFFLGNSNYIWLEKHWGYLVLGWIALVILFMIIQTINLFLWKKNYAFDFTPQSIYYREGVISMSEKNMPYSSIQDVTVSQGVLERIFDLAKVVIVNAAQQQVIVDHGKQYVVGSSGIILQGISLADAKKITDILKTTVLGKNNSRFGL